MKTKRAQRDGDCSWCTRKVSIGDSLFPVLESVCQLSRAAASADDAEDDEASPAAATALLICQPASQANVASTNSTKSSRSSVWIHATPCAEQVFRNLKQPVEPPPCRHWLRLNRCPFGSDCFFLHPTAQQQQQQDAATVTMLQQQPQVKRAWGGRRKKLFKPTSSVFRAWLLNTFGHDYFLKHQQQQQSTTVDMSVGVIDIAGGKGELAFEMENLSGIRTHVIDPRPLTLRNAFLKWISGHYDKAANNPVFQKYLTHYDNTKIPSYPGHLRVFFDGELLHWFLNHQHCQTEHTSQGNKTSSTSSPLEKNKLETQQEWWDQCRATARRQSWTKKGLSLTMDQDGDQGDEADHTTPTATTKNTNTNYSPSQALQPWLSAAPKDTSNVIEAISVLSKCSAVIGLHPDQATEACVDFALATNKPFAVVPCCVFSSMFPKRRLQSDGSPVRSTQQLIQYLMEKDKRIQVDTLGFEGMNKVVYLSPDQCHKQSILTA